MKNYLKLQNIIIIPKDIVVKDKEIFNIVNKSIKDKHKCYIEYYSKDELERIIDLIQSISK